MLRRAVVLAFLLQTCGPASADVVFAFTQTGGTPAGAVTASGSISLSDAAFANGVSITRNQFSPLTDWAALGVTALSFTVNTLGVTLGNLVPAVFPSSYPAWSLSLSSAPSGTLSGLLDFNNTAWDLHLLLDGAASAGSFNTDFLGGGPQGECRTTGVCQFTGNFAPIPEPGGLFLLGLAMLSIAAMRWRSSRSARSG